MAVYTTIDDPSAYFQTHLYAGSNSDITATFGGNSDLQPDWIWFKSRSSDNDHLTYDSVRGVGKRLQPNATDAEVDRSSNNDELKSFNTNGWTLGTYNSNITGAGKTCVSWNWKAGTAFSNDASSTGIGSIDSAGSVSETAGFSICSYTGTGSNGTIKHGLSTKPNVILVKKRVSGTANWNMQHTGINTDYQTDYILLDTNAGSGDEDTKWNDTAPTTSVFSVGDDGAINNSGDTYISYIFSNRQGYSKFGSYKGNGNANGNFIYTGFKPAWVMAKNTGDTKSWFIYDNKRDPFNPTVEKLRADTTAAEATGTDKLIDMYSNGFKMRTDDGEFNADGYIYIFLAFAENPFVTSGGVPATAR